MAQTPSGSRSCPIRCWSSDGIFSGEVPDMQANQPETSSFRDILHGARLKLDKDDQERLLAVAFILERHHEFAPYPHIHIPYRIAADTAIGRRRCGGQSLYDA